MQRVAASADRPHLQGSVAAGRCTEAAPLLGLWPPLLQYHYLSGWPQRFRMHPTPILHGAGLTTNVQTLQSGALRQSSRQLLGPLVSDVVTFEPLDIL
eukprot:scaffold601518_cov23-Prasinocladus_malaysianus.AAC.1